MNPERARAQELFAIDVSSFAHNGLIPYLQVARSLWRKYRDLIECDELPEPFRGYIAEADKRDAAEQVVEGVSGEGFLKPGYRAELLAEISHERHQR